MFFFIGGISPRTVTLDRQPRICPNCGRLALYLKRIDHYLSVFFIPLFPVKRSAPFMSCGGCGAKFDEQGRRGFQDLFPKEQKCQHCGRTIGSDFKYCPSYGNPIIFKTPT